jgi:hypothetical protein
MPNANCDLYQDDILVTQSPSFTIEQVKDITNVTAQPKTSSSIVTVAL